MRLAKTARESAKSPDDPATLIRLVTSFSQQTRIAITVDSLFNQTKNSACFSNSKESRTMTLIEITPHRNAWKVFEPPRVEPVFLKKDQAINYAQNRASSRSGEIRIFTLSGDLEHTVPFGKILLSVKIFGGRG